MFPGGMNPKQMKQMMGRMGIKADEIDAEKVVIYTATKNIVIENPEIMKMNVQGQQMYSISGGKTREEGATPEKMDEVVVEISEEDVNIVAEQTGVERDAARKALVETNGDIAGAIMKLKG
jgi:nascent polypeptide-associated complex subunit alpha